MKTMILRLSYGNFFLFNKEDFFRFYLTKEGLPAISKNDIDFQENKISVSKIYYRTGGKDVIITPKTEQSVRIIDIPEFLTQEIKEYCDGLYEIPDSERIFSIVGEAVQHKLVRHIQKAGV